jgi:hypothetical protein
LNQVSSEVAVHERTTRKSVTFLHPFSLAGIDEKLDAGTYIVETLEELIEGLSFIAYRRVSTTIMTAGKGYSQGARQVVTIDPRDLEAAQEQDAEMEISTGPPGPLCRPIATDEYRRSHQDLLSRWLLRMAQSTARSLSLFCPRWPAR